ncbi:RNA polymerase sigma factor [Cytobacillus spongiae]|uniref:RNA polymerase sigma factor n=1 Tax=Cytobacillus spongiae TaxID=2901381 RepID=UPI001F20664C|nr:RNA polymerase sigma factor [Cytobacillus spongiae]UII57749.1 RNA polymerase sigma factor [Cytobacillus spongiae]
MEHADERLMEEICTLYHKRLFHVAYGVTRDHHLAEDVVQESLIKAFRKIDTIHDQEKIGPWLCSITTRTAIDFIRKEKKKNEISLEGTLLMNREFQAKDHVEEEVVLSFLMEEVQEMVNDFTPNQKNIFILKAAKGMKEKEIAETLQLNPATVKTVFYRARKRLKGLLLEKTLA